MRRVIAGLVGLAAAAGPAAFWAAGARDWAWGIWLGGALGGGLYFWRRWTIRRALQIAAGTTPALKTVLWHSGLRLLVTAAFLIAVIRLRTISIWGVVLGYTLVQIPALWWEARKPSRQG